MNELVLLRDVGLLSLFRFKLWWMIPRVGNSGSDIPVETQMLLLEVSKGQDSVETSYVVFLPIIDGEFRSSLQGNSSNELEFCVESGDPAIVTSQSLRAVFVNCGNHPFDLIKESMKILEKYKGTFTHRESKQMPGMLDWFGWCTWDAFYQDVNPQGIREGLKSLSEGGTPAKFIIIDDGWQDVENEFQKEGEPYVDGSQFGGRLLSIKENNKFRRASDDAQSDAPSDLKSFVSEIKSTYGLKYVFVWHALMGYWGGLVPDVPGTKKYNPELRYPVQSPGNLANMRDLAMDCMEKYGVGAIDADKASQFLDDLHKYLVSQGVDGVKVDVQNILETISTGSGGRVSLTKQFQQALEKSISSNFQDNSIICCMGLSTDSIYHSKVSAITRASDDYYPKNPSTQTLHIAAVSYNSIFLGEVVVPDWDMFYSLHEAAEFHAAARAVGGCGVYVSDKPGHHDFEVLKRLVLPDGSILRARYPGRPSLDCLFNDPVMDGESLLKIWNLNKCTGVIGVFNCQGAGRWPCMSNPVQKNVSAELSGLVSPADIEYFEEVSGTQWTGDCAVFFFNSGSLSRVPKDESLSITLKVLQCEVLTVSPIKVYNKNIQFAAIGLLNMYNSGGAVEKVDFFSDSSNCGIQIKGRGPGRFGAYSSIKPKSCSVNSKTTEEFKYRSEDNLLTVTIPSTTSNWDITLYY
ncbi:probable galactinol--sucrose galactosyltransferase 2 isoform X2 [Humulus lupulus]|uniref:probable galactinol--sucrose galactosyltransferase 2 isoform X2 n=1 Tax=Humulus lupulus TaxID=3486 RepID=UPI002B40D1C1|nr:probable galactinol--sucrose galactosyltransferase 2 isoform X2 [Humulus lupulus]